jgi:hypothetical protein
MIPRALADGQQRSAPTGWLPSGHYARQQTKACEFVRCGTALAPAELQLKRSWPLRSPADCSSTFLNNGLFSRAIDPADRPALEAPGTPQKLQTLDRQLVVTASLIP